MGRETERISYIPKEDQRNREPTHEIWFNDEINQDSISTLRNIIEKISVKNSTDIITLKINSPGGWVWEVIELAEYFKNIQNPIKTIAEARCMSGAVLLVAAGDERSAWENCQFMIHQIQLDFPFRGSIKDLEEKTSHYAKLNDKFLTLLAEFSNQPFTKIFSDTRADKNLTAQEALDYGLIDKIIPRIKKTKLPKAS